MPKNQLRLICKTCLWWCASDSISLLYISWPIFPAAPEQHAAIIWNDRETIMFLLDARVFLSLYSLREMNRFSILRFLSNKDGTQYWWYLEWQIVFNDMISLIYLNMGVWQILPHKTTLQLIIGRCKSALEIVGKDYDFELFSKQIVKIWYWIWSRV